MQPNVYRATIASGQTASGGITVQPGFCLSAVSLPVSGFTGTALTFDASFDGGATWLPVLTMDGAVSYSLAQNGSARFVPVDGRIFRAMVPSRSTTELGCLIRVVSNASEAASRIVNLHCIQLF